LASTLALAGKKTVLIGADLRKPRIGTPLGIMSAEGLSEILVGAKQVDEILSHSKVDNSDVIISGEIPSNPTELLDSKKMETLIEEFKKEYD
jgi:Mrp family chromosome partitioning ATPase